MSGELVEDARTTEGDAEGAITFSPLEAEPGLCIVDSIERRNYSLKTPRNVSPVPVNPEGFQVPVSGAVRINTSQLTLPYQESVFVRDEQGEPVMHSFDSSQSCPAGRYLIHITTSVKLYILVEAPVRINQRDHATTLDFGGSTPVVVGALSPHRRPAGTITTTTNLSDLQPAVSSLSSALRTTSPERSWPIHRDYPPLLELGPKLSVPDAISPPETGITVEIRQSYEDLFVAAPLAFYLGAELEWGDRRLVTDQGFVYPLSNATDFETGVERILKQTFVLDCLARTEGDVPVTLDERKRFERVNETGLDFRRVYDLPIGERLEAYLDLPFDAVADLVPTWSITSYIEPTPQNATYLPHLLNHLSVVRTSGPQLIDQARVRSRRLETAGPHDTRSVDSSHQAVATSPRLVLPESASSVTTTWVGEGVPVGTSKALTEGFVHRLEREPTSQEIQIKVVCNESEMGSERDSVRAVYAARPDNSFEVDLETNLSVEALRSALERDVELFHFIGHIDDRGFRCRDGWLDVEDCGTIGPDVFLLNSCQSYEQGMKLIRNGSIAGIVTIIDLLNHRAAAIGRTLAQFLNLGLPIYAAHEAVRETYSFGNGYALLGDGHVVVSQPTTTIPEYLDLRSQLEDPVTVVHRTFPSHWARLGMAVCPPYEDGDRHYLLGGEIAKVNLRREELESLLALPTPLRDGGDLRFSLTADDGGS